jgi:hypothetical protein
MNALQHPQNNTDIVERTDSDGALMRRPCTRFTPRYGKMADLDNRVDGWDN